MGRNVLSAQVQVDKIVNFFLVSLLLIGFICLLNYYGYALLPFLPDETFFLQPAQNLAEGKGMGTPCLDDLLPNISQRTYWQPPVYFLVLAAWGKVMGFDIMSVRWMNRICGVGVLLLLWLLMRQWGVSSWVALMCLLWTALDLHFQYNSNIGRMDTLNALFLMACLLLFTTYQRDSKTWQAGLAGVFGALATLTHFIAIPTVLSLGLVLLWQRRGKAFLAFVLPLILGWLFWLVYAAQDWQSWLGQLGWQFAFKGEGGFPVLIARLPFSHSLLPLWGVFPINAPPLWFALIVASILSTWRKNSPLTEWQTACLVIAYFSSAVGGEWYVGWWTPFGYLLLSLWLNATFTKLSKRTLLLTFCFLWIGWQLLKVNQALGSVPYLKQDIDKFFTEVQTVFPKNSTVLLHSVPDPFQVLQQSRSDLRLVQLSPTPMAREPLEQILKEVDFFIGVPLWAQRRGVNLQKATREWVFHTTIGTWDISLRQFKRHEIQKQR